MIAEELLAARRSSGLSARAVAKAAGMSDTQLYRLEHDAITRPTLDQVARPAAVLGLRVAIGLYPETDPMRCRSASAPRTAAGADPLVAELADRGLARHPGRPAGMGR